MSIKRVKKIIRIYCEGKSEKNYFEALKRNEEINEKYVLKPNSKSNDLKIAIRKSKNTKEYKKLEGINSRDVFVYDSDIYKSKKKHINEEIRKYKEQVYFSNNNFEEFIRSFHKIEPFYKNNKKPNLTRQALEEIRNLKYKNVERQLEGLKKGNKFEGFKSIFDLLEELFKRKI